MLRTYAIWDRNRKALYVLLATGTVRISFQTEWDRLSYFSVLDCIGARHCIHGDGTTVHQVYEFRTFPCTGPLQTHPNFRIIGADAPDGGSGLSRF
jgi:hypothetical protein